MRTSFRFVFGFFFIHTTVFGQVETLKDVSIPGAPLIANAYPEVKGDPYYGDFIQGSILVSRMDTLTNIAVRFNLYGNMLEVNRMGELIGYSGKNIHGFIIDTYKQREIYRSGFDLPKLGKDVFVQILEEGDFTLLKYRYKIITDDPSAAYGSQKSKSFQNKVDFYIAFGEKIHLFKTKKKQLSSVFGDATDKVLQLIGDMNLDLREEEDMAKLVKALNK